MTKELEDSIRYWRYQTIVERDGEHCIRCGVKPNGVRKLDLDHADSNHFNKAKENLHLVCKKCHIFLTQQTDKEHSRLIRVAAARNEQTHIKQKTNEKRRVDMLNNGTSTQRANAENEPEFRNYARKLIAELGTVERKELIDSGAEHCQCSQQAIAGYLDKMTSRAGELELIRYSKPIAIRLRTK